MKVRVILFGFVGGIFFFERHDAAPPPQKKHNKMSGKLHACRKTMQNTQQGKRARHMLLTEFRRLLWRVPNSNMPLFLNQSLGAGGGGAIQRTLLKVASAKVDLPVYGPECPKTPHL